MVVVVCRILHGRETIGPLSSPATCAVHASAHKTNNDEARLRTLSLVLPSLLYFGRKSSRSRRGTVAPSQKKAPKDGPSNDPTGIEIAGSV